jgi:transposase
MTQEEELQVLREENQLLKELVAELLPLREGVARLKEQVNELEQRLAQDRRTSSQLPSSDGPARQPRRGRRPSGKPSGGQPGHAGRTLSMVEQPDAVERQRPEVCSACQQSISSVPGSLLDRRDVFD